jgi:hypothetical protein
MKIKMKMTLEYWHTYTTTFDFQNITITQNGSLNYIIINKNKNHFIERILTNSKDIKREFFKII